MPATLEVPRDLSRPTRHLYLQHVPTPIWERVHINAIRSGMGLSDYLIAVFATTEPLVDTATPSSKPTSIPAAKYSPVDKRR